MNHAKTTGAPSRSPLSPSVRELIALACVLGALFFIGLGNRPYATPSEARYIEIPRQMVETGDWVTPRLNGIKYFEKPPLFYWVQAAQIKAFGLGEFSGRFWTAALVLAFCLVTYLAGCKLYGRLEGTLSALMLGTCVLGFASSRIVLLDVPVSLFLVCAFFAFIIATRTSNGRKRDLLLAAMYICAALATLTKGLIGFVVPAMVIGSWIMLTNQWKLLLNVRLIPGLLLFLAIVVPWHILAGNVTPEFYHFYFIHEHFERFLTKEHGRYQPPWFFAAVLVAGFLPWTAYMIQSAKTGFARVWSERKSDALPLFTLLWSVLPFVFFSLSDSKLIPYILPIFPPLALIMARYLATIWRDGATAGFRIGTWFIGLFFAVLCAAYPVLEMFHLPGTEIFNQMQDEVRVLSAILGIEALAISALLARRASQMIIIKSLFAFTMVLLLAVNYLAPKASTRSTLDSAKPFAELLKPKLKASDEVVALNHYFQDLPIYLERNVTVVNAFGEMTFGMSIEDKTRQWMIDEKELAKRWKKNDHTIYILSRHNDYDALSHLLGKKGFVLMDNGRNMLISNRAETK